MKANWQDFYEKKKNKDSRGAREGRGVSFFCYIRGIGKAEPNARTFVQETNV